MVNNKKQNICKKENLSEALGHYSDESMHNFSVAWLHCNPVQGQYGNTGCGVFKRGV